MRLFLLAGLLSFSALAARPWNGGAVAAAHPAGSAAGREMLEAGGNAVDAAVATAFTMAVVGPYHSGLGGGGFAVVHLQDGTDVAFDFREVAPAKATRDMYLVDGKFVPEKSTDGALSIAVPGAVKGYLELQAKYGKLPRAKVLAPAIRAATQGFVVTPKYRDLASKRADCLKPTPRPRASSCATAPPRRWARSSPSPIWRRRSRCSRSRATRRSTRARSARPSRPR